MCRIKETKTVYSSNFILFNWNSTCIVFMIWLFGLLGYLVIVECVSATFLQLIQPTTLKTVDFIWCGRRLCFLFWAAFNSSKVEEIFTEQNFFDWKCTKPFYFLTNCPCQSVLQCDGWVVTITVFWWSSCLAEVPLVVMWLVLLVWHTVRWEYILGKELFGYSCLVMHLNRWTVWHAEWPITLCKTWLI